MVLQFAILKLFKKPLTLTSIRHELKRTGTLLFGSTLGGGGGETLLPNHDFVNILDVILFYEQLSLS